MKKKNNKRKCFDVLKKFTTKTFFLPKSSRDGGGGRSHGTCGVPDLRNKMRGVPDGCVEGGGLRKEIK